jgi:hypothetical protein
MGTIEHWCDHYDKTESWGLNMLINKDTKFVLIRVKDLITKCLRCPTFKKWCYSSELLVNFLSANETTDDWKFIG